MTEGARTLDLEAGEVLFREGDLGDSMYVIDEGVIELSFPEGKEPKILSSRQFFGEISLLARGSRRTATASARTPCRLKVVESATTIRLKSEHPQLLCSLLQETCAYLVASEQALAGDVRARNEELIRALDYLRRTREERDAKHVLAHTDELTGLYNRRCLNDQLAKFVERARETHSGLAALVIDLDHFKAVNDAHGHSVGDELLVLVGSHLGDIVRRTDLPCRVGGDEFVVLLTEVAGDEAASRAAEIHRSLLDLSFVGPDAHRIVPSASMGGTMLREDEDADQLMKRADDSLYAAKSEGRGKLVWRDPT